MKIGEIVKARRKKVYLTQRQLAGKTGLNQKTISCLESGLNDNTTLHNLRVLALALDCSVISLLPDTDKVIAKKLDSTF